LGIAVSRVIVTLPTILVFVAFSRHFNQGVQLVLK